MKQPDEFTLARLKKQFADDPYFGLYHFVFSESAKSPWTNRPDLVDPELAKAIVYETLKLVTVWLDENK